MAGKTVRIESLMQARRERRERRVQCVSLVSGAGQWWANDPTLSLYFQDLIHMPNKLPGVGKVIWVCVSDAFNVFRSHQNHID